MSVGSFDCQSTGGNATVIGYPWYGDEYAEDKSRFFKFVRSNRYNGRPTRLSEAVRYVYGDDYTNTEYKRLSRFAERAEWLETASYGAYVEVEPTPACFGVDSLEFRSKQNAKGPEGDGICFDTSETGPTAPQYPKDRVRRVLEKRVRLDGGQYKQGNDYRPEVLRELAQYRDDISDKWTYFSRIRGVGSRYLLLPYLTRYNDRDKATSTQRRYRTALERASDRFDVASVVSLTVDPDRFESHSEATEAIQGAVGRLMSCLSTEYRLGSRPDSVKVVDFQRNGLPHYHIVLFGVRTVEGETASGEATISTAEVREYWDETADIGREVDVRPSYNRGDGWILHDDSDGRVSLSYYLGKRIRGLVELAETDTDDLFSSVEAGDISLWRHTLFWAYEKQYCTVSPSLRGDRDTGLPSVRIWQYEGTARFEQIPSQVVDDAVICRSQPPP